MPRTPSAGNPSAPATTSPVAQGPAAQYDLVAASAAAAVLRGYSTSFGLATRLLAEPARTHVRNVYALVRVADEVVDAPRPGGTRALQARMLGQLEAETRAALESGHSANLIVHAFAGTARSCGIDATLTEPFFGSMRSDLFLTRHDADSFARYVHGSAEVVGLMCLRAFLAGRPDAGTTYAELAPGAQRLGAAFQKVNFLRDLGADSRGLGRHYFPGVDPERLDDRTRDLLLDDVDADLAAAAVAIERLPVGARRGVRVAHALFAELSARLRRTPAVRITSERIRVPAPVKARVVARALVRGDR